jgi:hypothetical protein
MRALCPTATNQKERLMEHAVKVDDRVGARARGQTRDLSAFDYSAPAELFLSRSRAAKSWPKYKRFDTAAEALRFVIQDLPATVLPGTYLLVDEKRFSADEVRQLYEGAGYPLPRAGAKS